MLYMWFMRYMKRNKKRSAWIVSISACSFLLTACGKTDSTLGQKMLEAAVNMLTGMGIVFIVLIFISLLISCFKFIYAYENKRKESSQPANMQTPVESSPVLEIEDEEKLTDDLELVAVITAAIAASTGSSPSGLVVRSIKRAPASKWKKA
jgi:glutaconyl-CoA/methylmalonyl-CoA decarboxylase subunit delta